MRSVCNTTIAGSASSRRKVCMSFTELKNRVKSGATALGNVGAEAIGELVTESLKGADVPGFIAQPLGKVAAEAGKEVNKQGIRATEFLLDRSIADSVKGAQALKSVGQSLVRSFDPTQVVKKECGARCQALKQIQRQAKRALKIEQNRFKQLRKVRIFKPRRSRKR